MGLLINRRRDYQRYPSPLRLTALEPTRFTFTMSMAPTALQFVEYSLDDGITWVRTMNDTSAVVVETPEIAEGESVLFRGQGFKTAPPEGVNTGVIASTGRFDASGDILGLINKVELEQTANYTFAFKYLFRGSKIVDASRLELPYILTDNCFQGLFYDCTELLYPPKLLAHHLMPNCYYAMFRGCTNLTIAPELPATTLATGCYTQMFGSCTRLVNAPDLPAERLVQDCYSGMFASCTSLVTMPELPATTMASRCYMSMFERCTSLRNVLITLPAMTLAESCYARMFVLCPFTTAPILPATELVTYCYKSMFDSCRNVTYLKCMAVTGWSESNTYQWVKNFGANGTFVKNSAATWENTFGQSSIPPGWTVETADS